MSQVLIVVYPAPYPSPEVIADHRVVLYVGRHRSIETIKANDPNLVEVVRSA